MGAFNFEKFVMGIFLIFFLGYMAFQICLSIIISFAIANVMVGELTMIGYICLVFMGLSNVLFLPLFLVFIRLEKRKEVDDGSV